MSVILLWELKNVRKIRGVVCKREKYFFENFKDFIYIVIYFVGFGNI